MKASDGIYSTNLGNMSSHYKSIGYKAKYQAITVGNLHCSQKIPISKLAFIQKVFYTIVVAKHNNYRSDVHIKEQ